MRFLLLLGLVVSLVGMSAATPRPGGADLRLGLTLLPEANFLIQDRASEAQGRAEATIPIGDPVSIRVRLWNAGDALSEPTIELSQRATPMAIFVKRPDGTTIHAPWEPRYGVVRAKAWPKSMRPGEEHVLETFLFERRVEFPRELPQLEYLFEEPGRYEIHAEYWVGDPVEHRHFLEGRRAERPPVLRSAPVVLEVAEPAIPGWQQLKDAMILHYAGRPEWPSLTDSTSPINAAIDAANRPWLNDWRGRLLARASEK